MTALTVVGVVMILLFCCLENGESGTCFPCGCISRLLKLSKVNRNETGCRGGRRIVPLVNSTEFVGVLDHTATKQLTSPAVRPLTDSPMTRNKDVIKDRFMRMITNQTNGYNNSEKQALTTPTITTKALNPSRISPLQQSSVSSNYNTISNSRSDSNGHDTGSTSIRNYRLYWTHNTPEHEYDAPLVGSNIISNSRSDSNGHDTGSTSIENHRILHWTHNAPEHFEYDDPDTPDMETSFMNSSKRIIKAVLTNQAMIHNYY